MSTPSQDPSSGTREFVNEEDSPVIVDEAKSASQPDVKEERYPNSAVTTEVFKDKSKTPSRKDTAPPAMVDGDDEEEEFAYLSRSSSSESPYAVLSSFGLDLHETDLSESIGYLLGTQDWDLLANDAASTVLNDGHAIFELTCRTASELKPSDLQMMEPVLSLSDFADEVRENNVPRISVNDSESLTPFTFILCKAMYGLPGASLSDITADFVSSFDYQRACQQDFVTILETDTPRTIRFIKPIIPYIYSITVQMRCTEFNDRETRNTFKWADGVVPDRVILLERTKRDTRKVDQTAMAKSVLLYYAIPGGLLVSNLTVIANTSIPRVAAKLVGRLDSRGGKESAEVLQLTRHFLINEFGDARFDE